MLKDDIDVVARSGYNDGYYWDYRFWFLYKGQKYTYINSGSGSGCVYNHEEIAKGFYKLHEGHRIDEYYDECPEVDYEELHDAEEELIRSGKDWCVIYADNGSENEESWIVKQEENDD